MTTRITANSRPRFDVPGLPSGVEGSAQHSTLTIPSVGLEDVDRSFFDLLDKEIAFVVDTNKGQQKVPVVFMSGENWAVVKHRRGIRDKNDSLILPIISAVRTEVSQMPDTDITGRGINQQTGEIVIKRRLSSSELGDRGYQLLVNRLGIRHQTNLAVHSGENMVQGQDIVTAITNRLIGMGFGTSRGVAQRAGQVTKGAGGEASLQTSQSFVEQDGLETDRSLYDLGNDPVVQDGGLLLPDRFNNVWETLVVPSPQFFTARYEVSFWTQYVEQMNHMVKKMVSSFLPQGNAWRLDTPKGYWFIATVENNGYADVNNLDDMSKQEKMIKLTLTVTVSAYMLVGSKAGEPVFVKKYLSSPSVSFDVGTPAEDTDQTSVDAPFLGSDDPTLPTEVDAISRRRDQRATGATRLYPTNGQVSVEDPALQAIPRGQPLAKFKRITAIDPSGRVLTRYVRVVSTNRFTGETSFAQDADLGGMTILTIED